MTAVYPGSIPTATTVSGGTLASNSHSSLHDNMFDEVVAIATEMGTNASGSESTVKDRIQAIEGGLTWTAMVGTGTIEIGDHSTPVFVNVPFSVTYSKYVRIGSFIIWSFKWVVTTSTTVDGTNNYYIYFTPPSGTGDPGPPSATVGYGGWLMFGEANSSVATASPRGYSTHSRLSMMTALGYPIFSQTFYEDGVLYGLMFWEED